MSNLVVNGNYFGFNPDSCVQAAMACSACGGVYSSNQGLLVFCPNCGEMATEGETKVEAASIANGVYSMCSCSGCGSELYSDLEPEVVAQYISTLYCTACGASLEDVATTSEDTGENSEDVSDELVDEDKLVDEDDDAEDEPLDEEGPGSSITAAIANILDNVIENTASVKMDLWESAEAGVIRNVIIASIPVARICLSDQENSEELEEIFKGDDYENTLIQAMLSTPVGKVLASVKARVLSELQEDTQPQVDKEIETQVEEQIESFTNAFKETFIKVIQGMSKNLFGPSVPNVLKEGLWQELAAVGVESPQNIIETVFSNHAPSFLATVMDKTLDLLDKPVSVRAEVLQMIEAAGTMSIDSTGDATAFSKDLAKGNFPLSVEGTQDSVSNLRDRLNLRRK
jgi:uncharacterized Zn finger protein (UPF0148 family)